MLSCKEVITEREELSSGTSGMLPKIQVHLHVLMCRFCRRYIKQSAVLRQTLQHLCRPSADAQIELVVESIKDRLKDESELRGHD